MKLGHQGHSLGGCGSLTPLDQKLSPSLSPPKWNNTFYRGLWSAIIWVPVSPLSPPCRPHHFEKSGYAIVEHTWVEHIQYAEKLKVHILLPSNTQIPPKRVESWIFEHII